MKNIYILNTLIHGIDTINLLKDKIKIKGIISLRNKSKDISGYVDHKTFCKKEKIKLIKVETYELNNSIDEKNIKKLKINILLVLGWQRLIPSWLINHCEICLGVHGSPLGITKGRGRSPQNWALMLGKKKFNVSLFKIDANIDSGPVISSKKFSYSVYDDIKTSYYKISFMVADMIISFIRKKKIIFKKQNDKIAEYYPKRIPDDGRIDWSLNSKKLKNFVNSLTKPYPGAFSFINKKKIIIWNLIPFVLKIKNKISNGSIIKIFFNKDILVKVNNGFVLIDNYELIDKNFSISENMKFEKYSFKKQIKNIIKRHITKYKDLKIVTELKKIAK